MSGGYGFSRSGAARRGADGSRLRSVPLRFSRRCVTDPLQTKCANSRVENERVPELAAAVRRRRRSQFPWALFMFSPQTALQLRIGTQILQRLPEQQYLR